MTPEVLMILRWFIAIDVFACAIGAYWLFNYQREEGTRYRRAISYTATAMLMAMGMVVIFGLGVLLGWRHWFVPMYISSVAINAAIAISFVKTKGNISKSFGINDRVNGRKA